MASMYFIGAYWFHAFNIILALVLYVISGLSYMRLAKLAGRSDVGWFAWIPILDSILPLLLIKRSGWLVLLYLIPIVNLILYIYVQILLLNAYGKHGSFVLLGIFVPPVYWILWIVWAFSDSTQYTLNS
jgi:hypothetical protein